MRMSALCRCAEYGYAVHILFSHFSTADPKKIPQLEVAV
uniref:Uncharacterized protein n=1 Tax=Klebsiella pneumoniae TaxID=573 RepID=A0A8B0SV69_KLEPN|nr:hypothetical protein [Klebsiella pneumoniae]